MILAVEDTNNGRSEITARYTRETGLWSATVTAAMISENSNILLTAIATDRAHNETRESVVVTGLVDETGPQINIASHVNNAAVPATGFLLTGMVIDETTVKSLFATLEDPVLGKTIDNHRVEFTRDSGAWTLAVFNGSVSENSQITIQLTASDVENNLSTATIELQAVAVNNLNRHMINRITFGPTPRMIKEVQEIGAMQFLTQQLEPDSIDDSEFDYFIREFQPTSADELKSYSMYHMIYSKR